MLDDINNPKVNLPNNRTIINQNQDIDQITFQKNI